MDRSRDLYRLQQIDTVLDNAQKRISEIDRILEDTQEVFQAASRVEELEKVALEKAVILKKAEQQVADQNIKIEGNQNKLYGGAISNPKDLEDLQLEASALQNYLLVLEDRQLEAMISADGAQSELESARLALAEIKDRLGTEHADLRAEKNQLQANITESNHKREAYLQGTDLPDLPLYTSLRETTGGIAVTIMSSGSCSSCGASIPSAIEQEVRSPGKLVQCPTCKRILHPE